MKYLILSDIHANLPAFEAVIKDADQYDKVLFLGDLANFGPNPAECVELLRKLNSICIMGNHDSEIASDEPKHFWDRWSKERLSLEQLDWIHSFKDQVIIDGHILAMHGVYTVPYDILPNIPDEYIENAFKMYLSPEIDEVWFGHYHYQIDRIINGITYRCIRPVGHHRDKDTRASYSVYEKGIITHKRVSYNLQKLLQDMDKVDCLEKKDKFIDFLANAYHEELLDKDIRAMESYKQ